jgi:hypothetical protein
MWSRPADVPVAMMATSIPLRSETGKVHHAIATELLMSD